MEGTQPFRNKICPKWQKRKSCNQIGYRTYFNLLGSSNDTTLT